MLFILITNAAISAEINDHYFCTKWLTSSKEHVARVKVIPPSD